MRGCGKAQNMKKWKKWEDYCNEHPMAGVCMGLAEITLIILVLWLAWFGKKSIGKYTLRNEAQTALLNQAQEVGLGNVRLEFDERSDDKMAYMDLYADKPKNMNTEELFYALRKIEDLENNAPNWDISAIYINEKPCYADKDSMKWDGKIAYRTPELREKERRIALDKPYVGMEAEYIEKTSLGQATEKKFKSSYGFNGMSSGYMVYTWCDEKGQTIFIAAVGCLSTKDRKYESKVEQVKEFTPKSSSSYGSYSYTPSSGQSGDKYHAKKYRTAEDFYDDNYDNFFSYEDAESYYEKHK